MIARLLFPLCLCLAALCAVVGFLSQRAIEESSQISTEIVELTCGSLIDNRPKVSTGVVVSDFVYVDRVGAVDADGDGKWDEVAVALFSRENLKSKSCYAAVIACFRDVPDLEALKKQLAANELKADYRVSEQELDSNLQAKLAKKFKSMDFKNSPVVTVGYGESIPVLGEDSLQMSYQIGAVAVGVAVLSVVYMILSGLFNSFKSRQHSPRRRVPKKKKTAKRIQPDNYDIEPTGGVLDRVRSMRDKEPSH